MNHQLDATGMILRLLDPGDRVLAMASAAITRLEGRNLINDTGTSPEYDIGMEAGMDISTFKPHLVTQMTLRFSTS